MERLRLDPADPLASVRAWLAALAAALGLDPSALMPKVRLNQAAARDVRRILADWSRELCLLVRAEAGRLARGVGLSLHLRPVLPRMRGAARVPAPDLVERGPGGVGQADVPDACRPAALRSRPHTPCPLSTRERGSACSRPAWDAWLSPAEDAALRRRTRTVLLALHDRSALVRRLAVRLGQRLARKRAALAALRGRLRFPNPPRAIGALCAIMREPEPRPPDRASSVHA